jgi:hypothetical protein
MQPTKRTLIGSCILISMLVIIAVSALLPPVHGVPRNTLTSNMRQIVLAAVTYSMYDVPDGPGPWPTDLTTLVTWTDGELVAGHFRVPGRPEISPAFIYIRPQPTATSQQPVLISDPRCTDGRACIVAYADGHMGQVRDISIWAEAQRLAGLPQARSTGVTAADWGAWIEPIAPPTAGQGR